MKYVLKWFNFLTRHILKGHLSPCLNPPITSELGEVTIIGMWGRGPLRGFLATEAGRSRALYVN